MDDTAGTTAGTAVDIPEATLLANDTDADGDTPTVASVDAASTNGGTVVQAGGNVTYTPAAGYAGDDTFNYTIDDGTGLTANAVVTVTVTAVGNAPTAISISAAPGTEQLLRASIRPLAAGYLPVGR